MISRTSNFEKEIRYKLYRKVDEIIHPSISKNNISNYKIIFNDNLLPVRVFYPRKVSDINKIIIYIPGDGNLTKCTYKYADICKDLAIELDELIIAIDYFEYPNIYPNILERLEEIVKYLYDELLKSGINKENITLMGDSTGGNYISSITFRFLNKELYYISREVLLYPLLSGNYFDNSKFLSINKELETNKDFIENIKKYFKNYAKFKKNLKSSDVFPLLNKEYSNYPKSLIVAGELDPLKDVMEEFYNKLDNNSQYKIIKYASHGFLNTQDLSIRHDYLESIKKFI